MQINNVNSNDPAQALAAAVQTGQTHAGRGHHHHHGGGGGDNVQLSDLAQQLAASDPSRISRLQAAVDAGTYHVSPNDVARSIIDSALSGL